MSAVTESRSSKSRIVMGRLELINDVVTDANEHRKIVVENWKKETDKVHEYITGIKYVIVILSFMLLAVFLFVSIQPENGKLLLCLIIMSAIIIAGLVATNNKTVDLIKYVVDKVHDVLRRQQENELELTAVRAKNQ